MGLKTKTKHRIIIAIYLCIFQAAIILPVLAIMEDRFAIVTGDFKAQTLLGGVVGLVVQHNLYAEVHQTEIVISLKEGGLIIPELDFVQIPYEAGQPRLIHLNIQKCRPTH